MKIKSIKKIDNKSMRYDLQTITQNFYADCILVHNSMIRPIFTGGPLRLRLATKMGVTDIAVEAEELLSYNQTEWLEDVLKNGITPILEYIAPTNKIVIEYAEPKLVLLALRSNLTGDYWLPHSAPFEVVQQYGSLDGGLADYIARARQQQGREGDIIRFADGHMVKIKNDWYVQIHKTKDIVRVDRNIVELILNETIDDTRAMLDPSDMARVDEVEDNFWRAFEHAVDRLEGLYVTAQSVYGCDKKRIALEMLPTLANKRDSDFIFRMVGGHAVRDLLLEHSKKSIGSTPKYDDLMEWMKA